MFYFILFYFILFYFILYIQVGQTTIQDIDAYALEHAINMEGGLDEPYVYSYVSDIERRDPFFAMYFTTERLLDQTDLEGTLEMDDTYKVIHEGYSATVIGQTDGNRVFHLRGIGVATNDTQEVGEVFLRAWRAHKPMFEPTLVLADAAEAYPNAARAVFPSIQKRNMCYAHVYKVKILHI